MNDMKKILAAIAVLLILVIALGVGIFHNLERLKAQNLTATAEARHALEARDLVTFKKCVDTEKILEQATEQILTAQINATVDPTAYSMDKLRLRYEKLKPDFMASARAALEEYITDGKVTFPAELTDAQKFFKDSGLASCEIKSVTKPHPEGNIQTSTVMFYNRQMNFNFELELELEQEGDGWRVTGVKGLESYYNGYRHALRHKLDSLNTPIVRKMDEIFAVKNFLVQPAGGDEYGFSKMLNIEIKADVQSDKPLAKIVGQVIIGRGDRESIAPFVIDMSDREQGIQTFHVPKTLNPFMKADADAMKHGLSKHDIKIEVTEIIFADGTNLKQLDKLPD